MAPTPSKDSAPSGMSPFLNPLVLVVLPSIYILAATISLLQFSMFLQLIANAGVGLKKLRFLDPIAPVLQTFIGQVDKIFGPANKFIPQPTHVILVAVLLALVIHMERRR